MTRTPPPPPAPSRVHEAEFGHPRHRRVNAYLNARLQMRGTLIAVHRGTALGMVVENTAAAVTAAARCGGDLVEIDVVESTDGDFFAYHDGYERQHFGIERNLQTLSTAEIERLAYPHRSVAPLARVERLETILQQMPDIALNIDRSWRYWPRLLTFLDRFDLADRLLMKVDARDERAISAARSHAVKYPLLPIATTVLEAERLLDDAELNVIGIETVTADRQHPFCSPDWAAHLHERGTFSYVNALDLGNGNDLLGGWDDTMAVLQGPDAGWGPLVDLGADVIQTDWPTLLHDYLVQRGARTGAIT
ncbi:glycerophosphodiester phosphodiesterase family protein [Microbacterium sp. 2216-1]|uniref:glycerophosphodiester phosphodiesterase family protein n=1 Tax=Microbacterium sp. 2216-1 TaxID=3390053 RepID=UPI003975888B